MKTANELRIEVANNQRMKKTRDKWLGLADRIHDIEMWQDKAEHQGLKIGDKAGFIQRKAARGGFSFTQQYGTAFAFSDDAMLVVFKGDLKRVNLE